jgi:hypothetical protein
MNKENLPVATDVDITTVAFQFILDKRIFSKFDVTKQLRNNGFWVSHSDVKAAMDEMDLPANYDAELIRIKGRPVFVYCPDIRDSIDYNPYEIPDNSKSHQTDTGAKISASKTASKKLFDVHGRFSVSAPDVRNAGFGAGAIVAVKTDGGTITVESGPGITGTRKLKVDCYCNIRIPKRDFENAFDCVPNNIDVKISQGKIEILEN